MPGPPRRATTPSPRPTRAASSSRRSATRARRRSTSWPATFGTEIAKERVDLLDVDRLFLLIDPPAQKRLDSDALFNRLAVAREGRVTALPYYSSTQLGAAIAFSSVLSLPYALDGVAAALR